MRPLPWAIDRAAGSATVEEMAVPAPATGPAASMPPWPRPPRALLALATTDAGGRVWGGRHGRWTPAGPQDTTADRRRLGAAARGRPHGRKGRPPRALGDRAGQRRGAARVRERSGAARWAPDAAGHAVLHRQRQQALHRRGGVPARRTRSGPSLGPDRRIPTRRARRRPAPSRRRRPRDPHHGGAPAAPRVGPARLARRPPEGWQGPPRHALRRRRPDAHHRGRRCDRARRAHPPLRAAGPGRRARCRPPCSPARG